MFHSARWCFGAGYFIAGMLVLNEHFGVQSSEIESASLRICAAIFLGCGCILNAIKSKP